MKHPLVVLAAFLVIVACATSAFAQDLGVGNQDLVGDGWDGFTNFAFLLHAVLILSLATALGAVLAYHPRSRRVIDTVEEAEAPKTYITYSIVGAVIGIMVVEYGLVVGFVVFGIGGLIRFRTLLPSATKTGRLILVTLIGLSAGLDLPHLAVLTTAFGYGLIYVLDARVTYRIEVKGLEKGDVVLASEAYHSTLETRRCNVVSEKRNLAKGKATFVFQAPPRLTREEIEDAIDTSIPEHLKGTVDWEVD